MRIPTLWTHNIVIIVSRLRHVQSKTRDFSVLQNVQIRSGADPFFYSVGYGGSFPEEKWTGHEANHSRPFRGPTEL
jgi:hypothetical protein